MQFNTTAILVGIQCSKGEYEGRPFDSTTFHIAVDLGEKATGETMGQVTRPFKLGTSAEFEKWKAFKAKWPAGGVKIECSFDIVAGAENSSKLTLLSVKPSA